MELFHAVNILKFFEKLNEFYNNPDMHKEKKPDKKICNKQLVEFALSRQLWCLYTNLRVRPLRAIS